MRLRANPHHLHRLARRKNPVSTRAVLVYGGAAAVAAIGWMLWQKHVAMTTPVTSLVPGGVYKIMNPAPPGPAGAAALVASMSNPLWTNVTASPDQTYVTATYAGPAASTIPGTTVYKVG
jgi:hypothetical protein